ncbi:MAG: amidase [Bryobacteraceae bacterium]|nr:amidase [Bryobacteraceae bacterium]
MQAADAIRRKQITSAELTALLLKRIEQWDPKLNAFTYVLWVEAMEEAKKADAALAKGQAAGPLHGVPVHVKESFGVQGRPATWGIEAFRDTKSATDSDVVQKLRRAGGILIGATNVPVNLQDWQTANPIYGVTNNPWNVERTSGGSSGGSAAALAAGLGFLSVGSDIGGSIRIPAHFCGVFGHKPTIDLISTAGQMPGGIRTPPGLSSDLAVAGPMARSADDLMAALQVLGGVVGSQARAFTWSLPKPRHASLRDFRIGYILDDPAAPISSEIRPAFEAMLRKLETSGAQLVPGWPERYRLPVAVEEYKSHLAAFLYSVAPKEAQAEMDGAPRFADDWFSKGAHASHSDWMRNNLRRLSYRALWQKHFESVDAFLSPAAFVPAFPHGKDLKQLTTPDGDRPYEDLFQWIATATFTGCPATVAPIGTTADGLPVGVQVMGPMWEDATPIRLAGLISQETTGGFTAPSGWQ